MDQETVNYTAWHKCSYQDGHLQHDGTWVDGRWYEWRDIHGNVEVARMKMDAWDHFYPSARMIEEEVVAFREIGMKGEKNEDKKRET